MDIDLEDIIDELDEIKEELKEIPHLNNPIYDGDNFIEMLRRENLLTPDLEDFMMRYMRYNNE